MKMASTGYEASCVFVCDVFNESTYHILASIATTFSCSALKMSWEVAVGDSSELPVVDYSQNSDRVTIVFQR